MVAIIMKSQIYLQFSPRENLPFLFVVIFPVSNAILFGKLNRQTVFFFRFFPRLPSIQDLGGAGLFGMKTQTAKAKNKEKQYSTKVYSPSSYRCNLLESIPWGAF